MSEKLWIGGIYLKEEGGYQIILRSLNHYKKRLQSQLFISSTADSIHHRTKERQKDPVRHDKETDR